LQLALRLFRGFSSAFGNIGTLLIQELERHIVSEFGEVDFLGDDSLMIEVLRRDFLR